MLIEQIIELKLRGPGPPCRKCSSTSGYFHDKTKSLRKMDYYLLPKCCTRQCTLLFPSWAKSLTNFNPKTQDFKRIMDLNCTYKQD